MYSCPFLFFFSFFSSFSIFALHFACGKYASCLLIVHWSSFSTASVVARIMVGAVVCVHFLLVFDEPQLLCVR